VTWREPVAQPEAHLALSRLFENLTPVRAAFVYLGLALCAASAVQRGIFELSRALAAPADARRELVSGALWGPSLVAGMLMALAAVYLAGLVWYRRKVRPNLLARAPLRAGGRARCRACDSELHPSDEPLKVCSDCHVVNI
jgi:hypothetical protein